MESLFKSVLEIIREERPETHLDTIYHYTGIEALTKILEEHCIWATNAFYLNDKREIYHAFDLISEIIDSECRRSPNELLEMSKNKWLEVRRPKVYIASFSQNSDSLSQWRAYGNSSNTYSIGFNKIDLVSSINGIGEIFDVVYDPEQQRSIIESIILHASEFHIKSLDTNSIPIEQQCREFIQLLILFLPTMKDQGFSEEKESRLIIREDGVKENCIEIQYRTDNGILKPFVNVDYLKNVSNLNHIPVSEVIIGPNKEPDLAEDSLWDFLNSLIYINWPIEVSRSRVHLRI